MRQVDEETGRERETGGGRDRRGWRETDRSVESQTGRQMDEKQVDR